MHTVARCLKLAPKSKSYFLEQVIYFIMRIHILLRVFPNLVWKTTEEKIRVTESTRCFINRKARKMAFKHILNQTLLLYSNRSLLFLENVSDLLSLRNVGKS